MMTADKDSVSAEVELLQLDRQAEKGTYLSKRSYMSGWVDLYAPDAPAAEWKTRPWKLKIEKDPDTGKAKSYRVKPEHAYEAFQHNGLVAYRDDWLAPKEKLTPSTEEKEVTPIA